MPKVEEHSVSQKLTWMNMLVSGTALLLACIAFIGYDMVTFRAGMVRNLSTQAQIVGSNTASALLFNDPQSAENTLAALKAAPNISSAGIYTPEGKLFAAYSRDASGHALALPAMGPDKTEVHWIKNNEIVLVRSIVFQGKPTETVFITSDVQELNQRLWRFAGIAAIVLAGCLLAALFVSSIFRKSVAEPIVHLAKLAQVVSREKNYSVRATPIANRGELAILIDSFNEMLTQIQRSEGALRKAHDSLEHRVLERTAELEAAKKEVEAFSLSVLQAKEEVERASKFKDQFLSTMSHELRTPLNAVVGFSDLLTEEQYGPLNEKQKRYVKHIHAGGHHLLRLINDILDLSKIEAGRLQLSIENVPVATTFAYVLDTIRTLSDKKGHSLSMDCSPDLSVRADATRFRQILMNLLGNAIKFTPDGGKIEVAARHLDGMVRVEVRDSGPGIPQEEQQRVFEAFYRMGQTEKAVEGTGLGLAITRRLVELQSGQLGIESQPGRGSCFFFTLPIVPRVEKQDGHDAAHRVHGEKAPRILVVENDVAAAHLLESQLTSAGYEAVVCDRPDRAVEMAAELQPGAITLDIVMKPISGWEVLRTLKTDSRTSAIPVIVVTIVDEQAVGALLGADEYIVKPVQKEVLLAAVERRLNHGAQPGRTGGNILVVEDDAPTREFMADFLSKQGYTVEVACGAREARAQVERSLPEIVILDLILPDASGFQLLAEWRSSSRASELPIFVLTSKDLTPEERDYLRTNTTALFRKQELWQEGLTRQLHRVVRAVPVGQT
jgi:signal transduction histidine kinase/DNA-binding response OmpR family regulator